MICLLAYFALQNYCFFLIYASARAFFQKKCLFFLSEKAEEFEKEVDEIEVE